VGEYVEGRFEVVCARHYCSVRKSADIRPAMAAAAVLAAAEADAAAAAAAMDVDGGGGSGSGGSGGGGGSAGGGEGGDGGDGVDGIGGCGESRFPRRAVQNRIIVVRGYAVRPGINHVSVGQATCHEHDTTQYLKTNTIPRNTVI